MGTNLVHYTFYLGSMTGGKSNLIIFDETKNPLYKLAESYRSEKTACKNKEDNIYKSEALKQ